MDSPPRLLFLVNVDWFFLSHRLPIALAAKNAGYSVFVATKNTGSFEKIRSHGFTPIHIPFERSGINAIKEIWVIIQILWLYIRLKPAIVHHVALKAVVYGSLVARITRRRKVINAISGMGYMFTQSRESLVQRLILYLMSWGFRYKNASFIFQNQDDYVMFEAKGLVSTKNSVIIKGSGVDLNAFAYSPPEKKDKLQILFPARMIKDKGLIELINAANALKSELYGKVIFLLAGSVDEENPSGLTVDEIKNLEIENYIRWVGFQKTMNSILKETDIVVLPSYREGLPKALIEACAIGRPIITTDTIGCRETVADGRNGYLVPLYDHVELANRISMLVNDKEKRIMFGIESRKIAEEEFSIGNVVDSTLKLYNQHVRS